MRGKKKRLDPAKSHKEDFFASTLYKVVEGIMLIKLICSIKALFF